jgi:hypothetical protein
MYAINYAGGPVEIVASYDRAVALICAEFPFAVVGHDGDLSDGGTRTYCWADETDANNDDGENAVASITEAKVL